MFRLSQSADTGFVFTFFYCHILLLIMNALWIVAARDAPFCKDIDVIFRTYMWPPRSSRKRKFVCHRHRDRSAMWKPKAFLQLLILASLANPGSGAEDIPYTIGPVQSSCDGNNLGTVRTREECELEACPGVDMSWGGTHDWNYAPPGCFYWTGGSCRWNQHPTGGFTDSRYGPVCAGHDFMVNQYSCFVPLRFRFQ